MLFKVLKYLWRALPVVIYTYITYQIYYDTLVTRNTEPRIRIKFFGMERLETFACHDVMKNPVVEDDLERFGTHLERLFPSATTN